MSSPEELVRKISDLMHELNINGLNGDALLTAADDFVTALTALLPTAPSGGGAAINDGATGPTTTWSSKLISELLAGRAPANWISELATFGGDAENPVDTGMTISSAMDQFFDGKAPANWISEVGDVGGAEGEPVDTGLSVSKALDVLYGETLGNLGNAFMFASANDLTTLGISHRGGFLVPATEVPSNPDPGKVYVIPNPDGTLGFHLPNPIPAVTE